MSICFGPVTLYCLPCPSSTQLNSSHEDSLHIPKNIQTNATAREQRTRLTYKERHSSPLLLATQNGCMYLCTACDRCGRNFNRTAPTHIVTRFTAYREAAVAIFFPFQPRRNHRPTPRRHSRSGSSHNSMHTEPYPQPQARKASRPGSHGLRPSGGVLPAARWRHRRLMAWPPHAACGGIGGGMLPRKVPSEKPAFAVPATARNPRSLMSSPARRHGSAPAAAVLAAHHHADKRFRISMTSCMKNALVLPRICLNMNLCLPTTELTVSHMDVFTPATSSALPGAEG